MRKTVIALLALASTAAFLAAPASATVLLSEGFAYSDGNLVPNGGWATHSGAGGIDIQVVSSRAVGNMNNAPDDNRSFTAQPTTAPTYACFEVTIPNPNGSPHPNYFAHLKDTGTSNLFARVYVVPVGASGFTFGLTFGATSATVAPVPWSASSLNYDTPYQIVIKYDPASVTATMWVNPASEASPSISHTGTGSGISISSFALRQSASAPTLPSGYPAGSVWWTYSVDNVGAGTTFNDACYQATPTKGSTWGEIKSIYR